MMTEDTDRPLGFAQHDHAACVASALAAAESHCAQAGVQLTPVRRRVLELLVTEHRALGAYDILETLRAEGLGTAPPAAYRALDFLVAQGLAHKIERLNAFVACSHPSVGHTPAFLICRACDAVAEARTDPQGGRLDQTARDAGFEIERTVIEAEGLCPTCREAGQ